MTSNRVPQLPKEPPGNKSTSKYIIQEAHNTMCPDCRKTVQLLCHAGWVEGKPAFYICFGCEQVREVGKGRVKEE